MTKKQGTTPSEGGVVPEEAVRDKAAAVMSKMGATLRA